jgi:amino acid transporter
LLIHLTGLRTGKAVQNILTVVKVGSLALLLACGVFYAPGPPASSTLPTVNAENPGGFGLALVFVLYAFGGWSDATTVTPEVRDCRRNMPRALLISLSLITALYLAVNLAYLRVLGFERLCQSAESGQSAAPAAEVIERVLGRRHSYVMSLMIMVSALGAIHGMLFIGCRLLAAVGAHTKIFAPFARWNARSVPVWSLLAIGGISLLLIGVVGTDVGRRALDHAASMLHLSQVRWMEYGGGFEMLLAVSAPVFWGFLFLTAISLMVLRVRDGARPRPFRVPGYPVIPLLFAASTLFMLWSSLQYAGRLSLLMLPVMLIGLILSVGVRQKS